MEIPGIQLGEQFANAAECIADCGEVTDNQRVQGLFERFGSHLVSRLATAVDLVSRIDDISQRGLFDFTGINQNDFNFSGDEYGNDDDQELLRYIRENFTELANWSVVESELESGGCQVKTLVLESDDIPYLEDRIIRHRLEITYIFNSVEGMKYSREISLRGTPIFCFKSSANSGMTYGEWVFDDSVVLKMPGDVEYRAGVKENNYYAEKTVGKYKLSWTFQLDGEGILQGINSHYLKKDKNERWNSIGVLRFSQDIGGGGEYLAARKRSFYIPEQMLGFEALDITITGNEERFLLTHEGISSLINLASRMASEYYTIASRRSEKYLCVENGCPLEISVNGDKLAKSVLVIIDHPKGKVFERLLARPGEYIFDKCFEKDIRVVTIRPVVDFVAEKDEDLPVLEKNVVEAYDAILSFVRDRLVFGAAIYDVDWAFGEVEQVIGIISENPDMFWGTLSRRSHMITRLTKLTLDVQVVGGLRPLVVIYSNIPVPRDVDIDREFDFDTFPMEVLEEILISWKEAEGE